MRCCAYTLRGHKPWAAHGWRAQTSADSPDGDNYITWTVRRRSWNSRVLLHLTHSWDRKPFRVYCTPLAIRTERRVLRVHLQGNFVSIFHIRYILCTVDCASLSMYTTSAAVSVEKHVRHAHLLVSFVPQRASHSYTLLYAHRRPS